MAATDNVLCRVFGAKDEEPSFKDRSSKGSQLLVPEVSYQSNDVADDKPSSSQAIAPAVNIDGGMIKGKFALYFYDDEDERECDGGELTPLTEEWEEESNHLGGSNGCESETEWWEKMLRLRSGDKELYKYQDLTKLNGNVVRLWDWDM
ncbi:putative Transmembrane protein [Quillaja saponaria]|uniref:Transmembrane protein n=1 Tax=Quillaja saponaria TaxID=32244 RepID=A0AAD7QCV6_QUISA|nr:putative Transmembrane protein [Quillaja saponaria]